MVSCMSLYVCLLCKLHVTSVAAMQLGMNDLTDKSYASLTTGLHACEAICELHKQIPLHNCV